LSGANFVLCCFVYAMYLLYAWFSLVQFSATVLPHVIRFVLFTNSEAIVSWLPLNILKNLDTSGFFFSACCCTLRQFATNCTNCTIAAVIYGGLQFAQTTHFATSLQHLQANCSKTPEH